MLAKLRSYLHERRLKQYTETNLRKISEGHFDKILSVGCLFDASMPDSYPAIKKFAKDLASQEVDVEILGYYPTRKVPDVSPFRFFTPEHVTFDMRPKSEVALTFMNKPFDVLINFVQKSYAPVNYLCAASDALFKVGPSTVNPDHYDLMIDLPGEFAIDTYIYEIRRTMNLIR